MISFVKNASHSKCHGMRECTYISHVSIVTHAVQVAS